VVSTASARGSGLRLFELCHAQMLLLILHRPHGGDNSSSLTNVQDEARKKASLAMKYYLKVTLRYSSTNYTYYYSYDN
jgi:hypothetical protein